MPSDPRPRRSGTRAGRTLVLALLTSLLSGACGGDPLPRPWSPGATVVIVGNRANMPSPRLTDRARAWVDDAVRSQDVIYLVGVSGAPSVAGSLNTSSDCDSELACKSVWATFVNKVQAAMLNVQIQAAAPEADLLGALALGSRQLRSASGPKHLIVIDSGLQTAGDMPLQYPGATQADPQQIAQSLQANLSLPDLQGVDVLFTGLGSTRAPQVQLKERDRNRLERLWATVLQASRPQSLKVDPAILPDVPAASGLPSVTSVSFEDRRDPVPPVGGCIRLRADQVGFKGDEATFVDPRRAQQILRPIAQRLISGDGTATLIGTTALPDKDPTSDQRLSLRRARAVQGALIELGVPPAAVSRIRGVGTKFRGFVPDTDAKGHLIETKAIQNRLVIIELSAGSCG
jgi:outer membrane protein OmpA-like peptidoglycan-associated protein